MKSNWKAVRTVGDNWNIEDSQVIVANVSGEKNAKIMAAGETMYNVLKEAHDMFSVDNDTWSKEARPTLKQKDELLKKIWKTLEEIDMA